MRTSVPVQAFSLSTADAKQQVIGARILHESLLKEISESMKFLYNEIRIASQSAVHQIILQKVQDLRQDRMKWKASHQFMWEESKKLETAICEEIPRVPNRHFHWFNRSMLEYYAVDKSANWKVRTYPIPVTLPVNLTADSVSMVLNQPKYFMAFTIKSDGVRVLLFMGHVGAKKTPFIGLIDRLGRVVQLHGLRVPECMLEGTVLDVEIVPGALLVFDCLLVSGNIVGHFHKHWRNHLARTVIEWIDGQEHPRTDPLSLYTIDIEWGRGLRLRQKREWTRSDIKKAYHAIIKTCDHPTDGIIATAMETPILAGANPTVLKIKDIHTVDFECKPVILADQLVHTRHLPASSTPFFEKDWPSYSNPVVIKSPEIQQIKIDKLRNVPSSPVTWLLLYLWMNAHDLSKLQHSIKITSAAQAKTTHVNTLSTPFEDSGADAKHGFFIVPISSNVSSNVTLPIHTTTTTIADTEKQPHLLNRNTDANIVVLKIPRYGLETLFSKGAAQQNIRMKMSVGLIQRMILERK